MLFHDNTFNGTYITTSFQEFSFMNYHDNDSSIVHKQKIIIRKEVGPFIKGTYALVPFIAQSD